MRCKEGGRLLKQQPMGKAAWAARYTRKSNQRCRARASVCLCLRVLQGCPSLSEFQECNTQCCPIDCAVSFGASTTEREGLLALIVTSARSSSCCHYAQALD